MKTQIVSTTTAEQLAEVIATASHAGATHAKVMKSGGKRAGIVPLAELDATYRGSEAEVVFGTKEAGEPFYELDQSAPPAPVAVEDDSLLPDGAKEKAIKPKVKAPAPSAKTNADTKPTTRGSGYVALIDKLLMTDGGLGVVEGFRRSKFSVPEALAQVSTAFPEKDPVSIKKVIKVRPRHLEKQKVEGSFDEEKNRAPRWRWVGPGRKDETTAPEVKEAKPLPMNQRVSPLILKKMKDDDIIAAILKETPDADGTKVLRSIQQERHALAKKTGDTSVLLRPPGSPGSKGNSKKLKTRELNVKKLAEKGVKVKVPAPKNGGVGTSRSGRKVRK